MACFLCRDSFPNGAMWLECSECFSEPKTNVIADEYATVREAAGEALLLSRKGTEANRFTCCSHIREQVLAEKKSLAAEIAQRLAASGWRSPAPPEAVAATLAEALARAAE